MVVFTIILLANAALTAVFWGFETKPFIMAIKTLPPVDATNTWPKIKQVFGLVCGFIKAIPRALPVIVDLGATLFLVGAFGMGGVIGAAMGMMVSNVISGFILYAQYSKPKKVLHAG